MKKKLLSILTALSLCLSLLPTAAFATESGAGARITVYFDNSEAGWETVSMVYELGDGIRDAVTTYSSREPDQQAIAMQLPETAVSLMFRNYIAGQPEHTLPNGYQETGWMPVEAGKTYTYAAPICADEDGDHFCDDCGEHLSDLCRDEDSDHTCDICWAHMPELCEDGDDDHWCDLCSALIENACYDENEDHYCDNESCGNKISECEECDEDEDNVCDLCGEGIYSSASDLNIEAVAGDGTITVTWDALKDAGEDKIASYTVSCCLEESFEPLQQFVYEPGSESYSHTFTGLENDVVYDVSVDAVYTQIKEGFEDPFSVTATDTVTALPGAPTILSAGGVNGFVTVEWEAPENKGFPDILYYVITAEQNGIGFGIKVEATGEETMRYTLEEGILNGQTYQIYVSAVNEIGQGAVATTDVSPYELVVGGVRVTADNAGDVLRDGAVSYDISKNILTLNGADITSGYAYKAGRVAGIYADGDLNIELGEAESSVTASADDIVTESYGIFAKGDLSISGSGSLTATAGAVEGTSVLSAGICVTGDLTLNSGSVTATGKKAEAGETGLGFSAGVYIAGDFALEGGSLAATAGIATGYSAQSSGIFTEGAFTMYDGSLTADGGDATVDEDASEPDEDDSKPPYATSVGIFTTGTYYMWGGSVTAEGAAAEGPYAYSVGVAAKSDLSLHAGSLIATGGSAEGAAALSAGVELGNVDPKFYLNLNVFGGFLDATGGNASGVLEANSAGVYGERSGVYLYGEDYIALTAGSATVTAESGYAASNGVYVSEGDVYIGGGMTVVTGGEWDGPGGDGWAIYANAVVEYDEAGEVVSTSGGWVTITCDNVSLVPSPGHGFRATNVTLTGVDEENGYAVYAEGGLEIGDSLVISDPEDAVIYEIRENPYIGYIILKNDIEGAPPAKSVSIELLLREVSFVIDGLDYTSAADVPNGMSLNEAYASMIEEAGGSDFSKLLITDRDGYIFRGFYTESGEKYDFDTPVYEDLTLTAWWSRNSSSGSTSIETKTTKNDDGSVTTSKTNNKTGEVTETTKTSDGVSGTVVTDKDGNVTEVSAKVPAAAAKTADANGEAVVLPVKMELNDSEAAVEIEIDVPSGGATIEIPVEDVTPGTVVVIVNKDGTEEIVKTSTVSENGVVVTLDKDATIKVIDNSKYFVDVHPVDHWAADAIDFVTAREIFGGTTAATFTPNGAMTRQAMWMVLARMSGAAPADMTEAKNWAVENGVSDGSNSGNAITRQQFVTMLYRWAQSQGYDVSVGEDTNILSYNDAFGISEYAIPAMQWACGAGVMGGYADGTLRPHNTATRAHVAQMLKNFIEKAVQ